VPRGDTSRASRALRLVLPVGLAVATIAVFGSTLGGEFLDWDDHVNFVDNAGYRGLSGPHLRWIATSTLMGHYIPMTWLTLALNYAVGGMNPWGYHAVNVALHAANALLVYLIARRLLAAASGAPDWRTRACCWGGAAAAALFALHPLRVESVAWITERRDVLSGLFYLLAVLAYLRAVEGPVLDGRWRALSLASFAAGLLSKASVMILPAVLLLLDWYPLGRGRLGWPRLLREKATFVALAGAGAVVALVALRAGIHVTSYASRGPEARAAMVAYSVFIYPARFLWPVGLSPLYEIPAEIHLWQSRFLGAAAVVALVSVALVALRRRWPAGLAAWAYSAVVVAPVSGVVHAGFQLAHDRYSYLSGLGFAVLAGGGLAAVERARASGRLRAATVAAVFGVAALAVAILAANTVVQAQVWHDSETLWRGAVAVDPRCGVCAGNLGTVLARQGRYAEAIPLLRTAYDPASARSRRNLGFALRNQGLEQARRGDLAAATTLLEEATTLIPEDAELHRGLGVARWEQGGLAQAHAHLERARALAPEDRVTAWLLDRLNADPAHPPVPERR
jgi:protein O-mannosyl-transferase